MEIAMLKNEVSYKEIKNDFDEEDWGKSQDMHSMSNLQSFNDMLSQQQIREDVRHNLDVTAQYFIDVIFTTNVERNNTLLILKNQFLLLFKVLYPEEFYDKIKSKEYCTLLGLEKSSKQLVCFSVIEIKQNKKKATVLAFGVIKEYQNKKVGTKILQKTLEELTIMGIETVNLIVQQANENAIKLYKKFGFEIQKEMNDYYHYLESDREKAAYLMKKILIHRVPANFGFFDFFKTSKNEKIPSKTDADCSLQRLLKF
jgi:ribosomal protein S18 acetylase RimI-like enzyme